MSDNTFSSEPLFKYNVNFLNYVYEGLYVAKHKDLHHTENAFSDKADTEIFLVFHQDDETRDDMNPDDWTGTVSIESFDNKYTSDWYIGVDSVEDGIISIAISPSDLDNQILENYLIEVTKYRIRTA
jgi:hypothetical protein